NAPIRPLHVVHHRRPGRPLPLVGFSRSGCRVVLRYPTMLFAHNRASVALLVPIALTTSLLHVESSDELPGVVTVLLVSLNQSLDPGAHQLHLGATLPQEWDSSYREITPM